MSDQGKDKYECIIPVIGRLTVRYDGRQDIATCSLIKETEKLQEDANRNDTSGVPLGQNRDASCSGG